MALSFFSESAAPRDFRISSTESDSHYTKCLLCYTIKKNFHCAECIKAGNFVNSSMPYSDRFAEKQIKLQRLKANRKHFQDRCEALLHTRRRQNHLEIDTKQCKDRIDLIKLAIEQRKTSINTKRFELNSLRQYNTELSLKLPKYQKRVMSLCKHAQQQRLELQNKERKCTNEGHNLAALRRARMRQLLHYIFPIYVSYDNNESAEELEFLGGESPAKCAKLHVAGVWLPADCDFSHLQHSEPRRTENECETSRSPLRTAQAALSLASQVTALLAWLLDLRLPVSLPSGPSPLQARGRRLLAAVWVSCARAGLTPPSSLLGLHRIATAAATDDPNVGRVEGWVMWDVCTESVDLPIDTDSEEDEPEHLHWVDGDQLEDVSRSPPTMPAPSLVTSAAASIASIWRGWTK